MDSEILGLERARHRRFRIIYRTALAVLLIAAAIGLVYAGFKTSTRSGWVVLIGLVVMFGIVKFMDVKMSRLGPDALASDGPWSFGQVYSGHQQREIWNSMGAVLVRHGMSFDKVTDTTAMATRAGSFLYRKGFHVIDVRPSTDHPGWFVISTFSQPDLPTTLTDFGRGAGINQELLEAVPGHRRADDPELH